MSCSISRIVRSSLVADAVHERDERRRLLRVHAGRRLVEQQQLRLQGQSAGHLEPALVAVRRFFANSSSVPPMPTNSSSSCAVSRGARAPRGADRACAGWSARGRRAGAGAWPTITFSAAVMVAEQADVLEGARHAGRRDLVRRDPRPPGRRTSTVPAVGHVEPGEHVEERGLAGAVRADQGHDGAGRDVEVDVVDGDEAAELRPGLAGVEQQIGHAPRRPRPRRSRRPRSARRLVEPRDCCRSGRQAGSRRGRNSIISTSTRPNSRTRYYEV